MNAYLRLGPRPVHAHDVFHYTVQYVERAGDLVWESVSIATQSPNQDHRKSVLIFWFLTNIRRWVLCRCAETIADPDAPC